MRYLLNRQHGVREKAQGRAGLKDMAEEGISSLLQRT
jgi:hypothetical protein